MYKEIRKGVDVTPFLSLIDLIDIRWNPPGWGSITSLDLRGPFGPLIEGEWVQAMLVGMKPLSLIPLHVDAPQRRKTRRIHTVLTTNPGCWSFHNGDWIQLLAGYQYEMDETQPHGSVNMGDTTRYHLIVDLL